MLLDPDLLDLKLVAEDVRRALQEDAADRDVTATLVPNRRARATIRCRDNAVLCGIPWVEETFRQVDANVRFDSWRYADGESVPSDTVVGRLNGPAGALLRGERVALNFLQLLSATATQTQQLVQKLDTPSCMLLDTRKTLPGLRHAQKYAVRCGGGHNHRASLADAVLLKENHQALLTDLGATIRQARERYPDLKVIVEVETLEQLEVARQAGPDIILLDNFDPPQAKAAVAQCPDIPLEVSGGITKANAAAYAATGAARISAGTLGKDVSAIDFSMRIDDN